MRIAIVSTPRSGNSWLRKFLAELLSLDDIAVNTPEEIPAYISKNCIIQIHWPPTHEFREWLKNKRFRIITCSRHPLDVLLSILHFVQNETESIRWVNGEGRCGKLYGLSPAEPEFAKYCTSNNASKLLDVSYKWASLSKSEGDNSIVHVRYEDLTKKNFSDLRSLLTKIGVEVTELNFKRAIDKSNFDSFSRLSNRHGWKGKSNNWIGYFTKESASEIFEKQRKYFEYAEYSIYQASPNVSKESIHKLWEDNKKTPKIKPHINDSAANREISYLYTAYVKKSKEAHHNLLLFEKEKAQEAINKKKIIDMEKSIKYVETQIKQCHSENRATREENALIKSSMSYRLANIILKPIAIIRRFHLKK